MDRRYPIGKFTFDAPLDGAARRAAIDAIAETPARLREAVAGLTEAQLDTPYREGGWTARQVVHHLPDSHLNSYIRFRLALTEEEPTIKPYLEDRWAELPDARNAPIEISLSLLESLHARWVILLRSFDEAQLQRQFYHPELGPVSLEKNIALYAWHGRHHVAQITALRQANGW